MNDDDQAWSRSLASGDERAFRLLVERETTRVFRACYRVLGQIDDAEEATQETFVLAYRALGTYRGDGHPAAWLLRIATREAWRLANVRSRGRSISMVLDDAVMALPSSTLDPAESAIAANEREELREAVGKLPELYREIITLRYFADLSLNEICALTGRPGGTVKAQIHRGLGQLRVLMAEESR